MALQRYNITLSKAGAGTFTVPPGCTEIHVTCIGAGGGTTLSVSTLNGAGGGAYVVTPTFAVTPGSVLNYQVGAGGVGNTNGGDTWFKSASDVMAQGGWRGSIGVGGGGASIGDQEVSGGAGGQGYSTGSSKAGGGGGANGLIANNFKTFNGANALSGTSRGIGGYGGYTTSGWGGSGIVYPLNGDPATSGQDGYFPGGGAGGGGYKGGDGVIYLSYLADLEAAPPPTETGTEMFIII